MRSKPTRGSCRCDGGLSTPPESRVSPKEPWLTWETGQAACISGESCPGGGTFTCSGVRRDQKLREGPAGTPFPCEGSICSPPP